MSHKPKAAAIDPVLSALAAFEAADRNQIALAEIQTPLEEECFRQAALLRKPEHEGVTLTTPEAVDRHMHSIGIETRMRFAMHKALSESSEADLAEVADLVERFRPTPADQVAKREMKKLHIKLHVDVAEYMAATEKLARDTGMQAAMAEASEALEVRDELADKVLRTVPTTDAGAAALARFAISEADQRDDELASIALASLAAYLSRSA